VSVIYRNAGPPFLCLPPYFVAFSRGLWFRLNFSSACSWRLRVAPGSFHLRIARALQAALVPLRLFLVPRSSHLPGIAARAELCPAFVADFYLHSAFYLHSLGWRLALLRSFFFPRSLRCFLADIAFD
jgi:hypothetical protein